MGRSATQPMHCRGSPNKGTKSKVAASPLPSWGPTSGRKWYVTPAFSGVPKQADKIKIGYLTLPSGGPKDGRKCYATPALASVPKQGGKLKSGSLLKRPQVGASATLRLHFRGLPNKGTNSKVVAALLPSWGPTSGRKSYVTSSFPEVPEQGDKIKSGCLTTFFSGAHKWTEVKRYARILGGPQTRGQNLKWLPHPCLLGGLQVGRSATQPMHCRGSPNKGTKSKVAASPLPSWGPTSGRKWYVTPAFSGVPKQADKIKIGYLTLPSGGPKDGRKCYATPALASVPKQGGKLKSGSAHKCSSQAPTSGRKCYVTPAFPGVAKQGHKLKSACLTPAFLGAYKWAEKLRNIFAPRGPRTRGQNQKWLPHPLLLGGPQVDGSGTLRPHSRGLPNKGTNSKVLASLLPSCGPTSGRKSYVTSSFPEVPEQGDKIKSGCLTPFFSGGHKWTEVKRYARILGGPQTRGQNLKWLPHPCLLGGAQKSGSAT